MVMKKLDERRNLEGRVEMPDDYFSTAPRDLRSGPNVSRAPSISLFHALTAQKEGRVEDEKRVNESAT